MPSFSIEVPGEANPLTENLLVHTLRSASSSDPQQIQTGTKQLQSWERSPGYYKHLQSAYLDRRLPLELRYLAVIQLKNGIDKYWRKTATNAVSNDDKTVIRSRLLDSGLHESDDRLALQNALVIAKIARFEYPNDWPDALSGFVQTIRNASQTPPLQLARALLILLHLVKELSTGRLQRTRRNLQAATPEIVHVLGGLYGDTVAYWQRSLTETSEDVSTTMKLSLLAIKVLRRLLVSGYEQPNRNQDVVVLWSATQQQLSAFIRMGPTLTGDAKALLDKNMLQLAKLHHEMAREHPAAFALLPNSVDLAMSYWSLAKDYGQSFGSRDVATAAIGTDGDLDEKTTTEKLALRGLLILRACVKMVHNPASTFKYRTPEDKEEKIAATELLRQHLLSQTFIQEVMEVVVTRFFVFRPSDLREWEEEPEEWEKREEGDGEDWEFSIRSCSEKLFLDLAINYKEVLVQPLLQVFYSVATPENEDVLFKDSVYTAIGLAAPVVHGQLDFDAFIRDVLVAEVQKQKPGFNILRRRAAILLGQWISVKITERPLVYQIFQHLLSKDDPLNDQVVRVTAGRQFTKIVDDWDTKADELLPYTDVMLTRLMHLIEEVDLTETKMALLNTISVIVERMEHRISPFAQRIVSMLPALWEASGEEHLMKQAILTILARLVNAMKAESQPLHGMVIPIIKGAVQPGSDTEVYLLEDAMDLWAAILVQTAQPASDEVLQLVPYLFPIYEFGSEHLRKALEITESYVLLAPNHMLGEVRVPLFAALTTLVSTLKPKPEANGMVCNIVEVIIRAAGTSIDHIDLSAFTRTLVEGLRGSWVAHCTTGPLAKDSPVDGIVETDYFAVLARLILASLGSFTAAVGDDATMKWLLEEWFSHLENIGDPSRRKLMCLALTKLLETNQPFILLNLQSLMTMWTDVITELREGAEDANGDSLVYANNISEAPHDALEAPEDARRRLLTHGDEVHTVNLPDFVRSTLRQAIAACGGSFEQDWLVNVDKEVVNSFTQLGIM
ncbi:hypothetical protein LTR36_005682 [Oleoguttula mirabilis]|uniref:Importin N-terminal domain-containing protein n=1 Tax=Oleoguttula mirabilis TaxID=1507867 RepID=A0AAV9JDQ1_9PEZI|nr:hypothetical protein LTR36_005682 [Oleoguttula mirabilis]